MKKDPRKYKWYVYVNRRKANFSTADADKDFSLKRGEKFGLKKSRGNYFLIDGEERETQFKLTPAQADRVLNNSKGWSGKIGRVLVKAGTEGRANATRQTVEEREVRNGYIELRANSSVLRRLYYNKKEKKLIVLFPNNSQWMYFNVTPTEAKALEKSPSQGRYFNLAIKAKKDSDRIENTE